MDREINIANRSENIPTHVPCGCANDFIPVFTNATLRQSIIDNIEVVNLST